MFELYRYIGPGSNESGDFWFVCEGHDCHGIRGVTESEVRATMRRVNFRDMPEELIALLDRHGIHNPVYLCASCHTELMLTIVKAINGVDTTAPEWYHVIPGESCSASATTYVTLEEETDGSRSWTVQWPVP